MANVAAGTRWRDERGPVTVTWVNDDEKRVGYCRDGRHFMLGWRRFQRDFTAVPTIEASEDHPAIYREGRRLVAGREKGRAQPNTYPNND